MTKKICIIAGVLLAAICICVAAALIFPVDKTVIYRSDNISVKQVEYEERQFEHQSTLGITVEQAFQRNTVIIAGTISNVREAVVSYTIDGVTGDSPITLFDMSASDVLFTSSNKLPQWGDLTVGVGYNNSCFGIGRQILEEGKSFLMFCVLTEDMESDPLEASNYADLWVLNSSNLLFEQVGEQFVVSNVFADYLSEEDLITSRLDISETQLKELESSDDFIAMAKELGIKDDIGFFFSLEGRYTPKSAEFAILLETGYLVEKDVFLEMLRQRVDTLW